MRKWEGNREILRKIGNMEITWYKKLAGVKNFKCCKYSIISLTNYAPDE
jgi:hypothetical protein